MLLQATLRKEELGTLACHYNDRLPIFEKYRSLLTDILIHRTKIQTQTHTQISSRLSPPSKGKSITLYTRNLYREWAYLEAVAAVRTGDRHYFQIIDVVQAYLEGQLDTVLPPFIATLKLSLLVYLNKAYKSKTQNVGFDMFENIVTNETTVIKWKLLRDIKRADILSDLTNEQRDKIMRDIDDPFHNYDFLVKKYLNT